jgi:hypothetical protein
MYSCYKKNPGGGEIFRTRSDPHPASYTMGIGYFPERGADHPPPPSAEVVNE